MKKILTYTTCIVCAICGLTGCVKQDFFGKSSLKQILYFNIGGQVGNTRIVEDSLKVYVTMPAGTAISSLAPDSIALSTFAGIFPATNQVQNFSQPVAYTVTAEDGTTAIYQVEVGVEGSEPQLENTGFDDWYTPPGKAYQEPGLDASSIWASANAGVTTTGSNNFNTTPELIAGTDYLARLETKDLGSLAQITGQRIGSATLFTGKFVLNVVNPSASAIFGIGFTARPAGFSVDLNYAAGTPYKDGYNKVLNKIDSADIYLLLENRDDPSAIKRMATGWYRMGTSTGTNLQTINVALTYGELPSGTPSYQKPANNLYGNSTDAVTHITVVFASSANGILYEGGVGSLLKVNNLKLNY